MRYFQGNELFFGRKQRYYAKIRHFCKWEVSITPKNRQKSSKNHQNFTHFGSDRQKLTPCPYVSTNVEISKRHCQARCVPVALARWQNSRNRRIAFQGKV